MDNFQDLMNYVLPWAVENKVPIKDITFRCFLHIEQNAGLLSRYNTLIAAKGATPQIRQIVNQDIAKAIATHLGLKSVDEIQLPKGKFLINSYSTFE